MYLNRCITQYIQACIMFRIHVHSKTSLVWVWCLLESSRSQNAQQQSNPFTFTRRLLNWGCWANCIMKWCYRALVLKLIDMRSSSKQELSCMVRISKSTEKNLCAEGWWYFPTNYWLSIEMLVFTTSFGERCLAMPFLLKELVQDGSISMLVTTIHCLNQSFCK
jgi:hypothetical protein